MFDLDYLIRDYLESVNGQPPITWSEARETWPPGVLHVTDMSSCPRKVAYRLRGEPEEPRPPQDARKFVLANFQHELIYKALDYAGILVDKEVPVPMPEGWSGTADMVLDTYWDVHGEHINIADSKNPVAGAKKYFATYPKEEDIWQVATYAAFLGELYPVEGEGQVFYLPLGGASRGLYARFPLPTKDEVVARMEAFEAEVRGGLPDVLPMHLFWANRRTYTRKDGSQTTSGDIVWGADWRCGYCRFDCPNRGIEAERVARVSSKGVDLTALGRTMADEVEDFIISEL